MSVIKHTLTHSCPSFNQLLSLYSTSLTADHGQIWIIVYYTYITKQSKVHELSLRNHSQRTKFTFLLNHQVLATFTMRNTNV